MKLTLVRFIALACIGGCHLLPSTQVSEHLDPVATPVLTVTPEAENGMSENLIRDRGKLISLRVYSVDQQEWKNNGLFLNESGSGVLMAMEPTPANSSVYQYLVLTANHVAKESSEKGKDPEFYIRTPDGLIHKARRHPQKINKTDLALLSFYSPYRYEVAVIAKKQSLKPEDPIYVTGFPCDLGLTRVYCPAEFVLIQGQVKAILTQPLVDNYSIGYTNEVVEGTSGGPILNAQGEVVGINGRREGGSSSQYKRADGSESTEAQINSMKTLRWGIPIDFYLKLDTKKLFKEIPPFNQEFVPIGYISKSDPQTNPSKQTPSADSLKSSEVKPQVTSPENHKNTPSISSLLSRLEDDNNSLLKLFLAFFLFLAVIFLLYFLDRVRKNNSNNKQSNLEAGGSTQNIQETALTKGKETGVSVGGGHLFFHWNLLFFNGTKKERQEKPPIANISLNFLEQQNVWRICIVSHDSKITQSCDLYDFDLSDADNLQRSNNSDNYWFHCKINEFTIFINPKIQKVAEKSELVPKLCASNNYTVKPCTPNQSSTYNYSLLYRYKQVAKNKPSKIIMIEFVHKCNDPLITPLPL